MQGQELKNWKLLDCGIPGYILVLSRAPVLVAGTLVEEMVSACCPGAGSPTLPADGRVGDYIKSSLGTPPELRLARMIRHSYSECRARPSQLQSPHITRSSQQE
jgi:hypothetical protein